MVMVMIGLYLFYFIRIGNEEEQIAQLDQDIARQQARLEELAPYKDLQARLNAKKPIADGIFRTRFAWDEFLNGLAFVIPEATALDVFTGTATPINITVPSGGGAELQTLDPPGSITFSGIACPARLSPGNRRCEDQPGGQRGYQNVADFIVRMNNLRYLANADLNAAARNDEALGVRRAVTFEVNAELVTRVGEFGDEIQLTGVEEGSEEDQAEEDRVDEQAQPQAEKASWPRVDR